MEIGEQLVVPNGTFPYLVAQRGAISDMQEDRRTWLMLYAAQLEQEFKTMKPYLPEKCESILDVGSGAGGINILLNRHYGGNCEVTLLDGMADPPFVTSHAETFASFEVGRLFLKLNGIQYVRGIDAAQAPLIAPRFWDLVVSQKSWCFHYDPQRYLSIVMSGCTAETRLVVDVRSDKFQWMAELSHHFKHVACARVDKKHCTHIFKARESEYAA